MGLEEAGQSLDGQGASSTLIRIPIIIGIFIFVILYLIVPLLF
jgi:hypothetical protein